VIRIGTEGTQTQTFIAGIYNSTVSNVGSAMGVVVDNTGNLGTVALSSLAGATGATGPAGPTGAQGIAGANGVTGAIGPAGPTGATGADGAQGTAGATGATGPGLFTDGYGDTAGGTGALTSFTPIYNPLSLGEGLDTAFGYQALHDDTIGYGNTAFGIDALERNTTGDGNTALGGSALGNNSTGGYNVAIGDEAGGNLTTGSNNIEIFDPGTSADSGTIRLGTEGTQQLTFIAGIDGTAVTGAAVYVVSGTGQLGVQSSSQRFKTDIRDMGAASEAILALRPVTYHYRQEIDPKATPQFGLVAEEVEKISPDLVVHDKQGKAFTVRYEAVNAMLLNEFRKQHEHVKQQDAIVANQSKKIAVQQEKIEALEARLNQVETLTARLDALEKLAANK